MENNGVRFSDWSVVLSCEHATNHVPDTYKPLFRNERKVLNTHRAWDPGTIEMGAWFSRELGIAVHCGTVSRLIIELNRSLHHRALFSQYSRVLNRTQRDELIESVWRPYRQDVTDEINNHLHRGRPVLHLSLHSFTPALDGDERRCDIGLLYDPARSNERAFCSQWKRQLEATRHPPLVRRNYPYSGVADGFTSALRRVLPDDRYAGIEIEINQKFPLGDKRRWQKLLGILIETLPVCHP